jgi:hypothetical protein
MLLSAPVCIRALLGVLLALLITTRLLSPPGFMPSFEHGTVVIVSCPDFDSNAGQPMQHHGHGKPAKAHQPCPYAAASGSTLITFEGILFAGVVLIGIAFLFSRTYRLVERSRRFRRPPPTGPPLPV